MKVGASLATVTFVMLISLCLVYARSYEQVYWVAMAWWFIVIWALQIDAHDDD